eukprot:12895595-Prorocentrum_lima.AAC.1
MASCNSPATSLISHMCSRFLSTVAAKLAEIASFRFSCWVIGVCGGERCEATRNSWRCTSGSRCGVFGPKQC